jgi:hypothetical protein
MIENAINPVVLSDSDAPAPVVVARTEEKVVPVVLARTKAGTQTFTQSDWKEENPAKLSYILNKPIIPRDSEQITYDSTEATTHSVANVEAALDKLFKKVFFTQLSINSFFTYPNTTKYQIGQSIASITFKWTTNIAPKKNKLIIDSTIDTILFEEDNNTDRTSFEEIINFDNPIESGTTFTLYCYQDDINSIEKSYPKSYSIGFYHKIYYWKSKNEETSIPRDKNNNITSQGELSSKPTNTSKKEISIQNCNNEYVYIAAPKSWGTIQVLIGGFLTSGTTTDQLSFRNESGYSEDFTIYRTNQLQKGNVNCVIYF